MLLLGGCSAAGSHAPSGEPQSRQAVSAADAARTECIHEVDETRFSDPNASTDWYVEALDACRDGEEPPVPTPAPTREPLEPTPVQLENERYQELLTAAGRSGSPALGRAYCDSLRDYYQPDTPQAAARLVEDRLTRDRPAIEVFCPEFLGALSLAEAGFFDGTHRVGDVADGANLQVAAGTYATVVNPGSAGTSDCYWERSSASGETIANDFVTLAPEGVTVTIQSGEGFSSQGCGAWLPAR